MISILVSVVVLVISVVIHEVAHGVAAYFLGDKTAYRMGRLSLNPICHLDPLGSVVVPLFLGVLGSPFVLGWAKPVPISTAQLKWKRIGVMFVAIAGPLSNILLALIMSVFLPLFVGFAGEFMLEFCISMIYINLVLALFNLIPIPPLDGSRILACVLPKSMVSLLDRCEPYGLIIICLVFSLDVFQSLFSNVIFYMIPMFIPFFGFISEKKERSGQNYSHFQKNSLDFYTSFNLKKTFIKYNGQRCLLVNFL